MISRFDLVVGSVRAAELINSYRERLEREDLLSNQTALNVACIAYATGNIYTVIAPGQIWELIDAADETFPAELTVVGVEEDCRHGKAAVCRDRGGTLVRTSLTVLDEKYRLVAWPRAAESRHS
ncbi:MULTISPECIES: hypothetical protein [unclassified Streptomyces]|uniref:Uncharacterized protein n=1 Tax=Streptomyces sp. NBC_00180 TaxID=2903632 RepID=A0AAU1I892_9ACTN|nr:hypothetical protein OG331_03990 [Streptomyces sp. NBC_01017]WSV34795.1 hypothetical protein OG331_47990 [Streptomyces sp. NBC_01017]